MKSIRDLLNTISDFKCGIDETEFIFPGILQEKENNIVLNVKFTRQQYLNLEPHNKFDILGKISGKEVTLVKCQIKSASCTMEGEEDDWNYSIFAIPSEVIIGGCFTFTPMISRISAALPELNYMFFGTTPLKQNVAFSRENPSLLKYTFPDQITAKDNHGNIKLYQTFAFQWSIDGYIHNIISVVDYSFKEPSALMDGVAKISVARMLFSFFGNGYIPYGNITFSIDGDEKEYALWLNYQETVPAVSEPFLITTSDFEKQFQEVWTSWINLYEKADPISTLFYEIICNRSTRVNSFLNLSQTIEIYSNAFRYDNAKSLAAKENFEGDWIPLRFIYQDILCEYSEPLGLQNDSRINLSKGLSKMRNYYTHYNDKSYVAPEYDELFAANRVLRFILLTIVYISIGIPRARIFDCKQRGVFSQFDKAIETILNYSKKQKLHVV